jgi:hypothetical protein
MAGTLVALLFGQVLLLLLARRLFSPARPPSPQAQRG